MKQIIEVNRALFKRARELNTRAGREVFPIPTQGQLAEVLQSLLGNISRLADIRLPELYLLPALDEHVVAQVLAESPDGIKVLGREVSVEYRLGDNPLVRLDFRGEQARNWLLLPDSGIRLPNGCEVAMCSVVEGYNYPIEAISSQFKVKVSECLNHVVWERWHKPPLPAPVESISEIVEMEYGRCVVSGVPLIAYGTVSFDSWYGSWKSHWSRDRAEADKVRAQACAKFDEVRERVVFEALRKRVGQLHSTYYYNNELPQEMRIRLYNTCYGYAGGATTVAKMEALIAEVEAVVVAIKQRKDEVARVRREVEARQYQLTLDGLKRIDALNLRLVKIGWDPIEVWNDAFESGGQTNQLSDHVAIARIEAEVAAEEAQLVAIAQRDAERHSRQVSESSLAALAEKFSRPNKR